MSLSLTIPGLSVEVSRSSAYFQLAGLLEVSLTGSLPWSPLLSASRHEVRSGFNLIAGPFCLDICRA